MSARLTAQMAFLNEACRLKSVERATTLCDASRFENSAEHSWHVALYALVLGEHAPDGVDADRVIRMLLLHDLVEIDAGDAPIFAASQPAGLAAREAEAARRIFGLLPGDQAETLHALWREFEAGQTADARFAKALDRFQPPNQNLASGGVSWVTYAVSHATVEARLAPQISLGAPALWRWIRPRIAAFFAGAPPRG